MALVEFSAFGLQLFLQKQNDDFGKLPVGGKSSLLAFGDQNPILFICARELLTLRFTCTNVIYL